MKSIVEEASSLAKAFTQGWERAGKPQECTVKILAEPEKNFLGMTTKSAKIAIFFTEIPPVQSKKNTPQPQQRRSPAQQQAQPQRQQAPRAQAPRQESRPTEQRSNEQRATESRSHEQRSNDQRSNDHHQEARPATQRPTTPRQQAPRAQTPRQESRPTEQRSNEQRSNEQRSNEQAPREQSVREVSSFENSSDVAPKTENVPTSRVRPTWSDEMTQGVRAWIQESLQIMGCAPEVGFTTSMARSTLTVTFTNPIIEDLEKERLLFRSWSHLIVQHIKQESKVHGKELKIILKGSRN